MLSGTTIFSLFLATIVIMLHDSSCNGYQMMAAYPLSSSFEERHLHRREPVSKPEDNAVAYPKLTSDIFGSNSEESSDKSRMHEENDSSLSSDEAASMLDFTINHPSQFTKRRKGPTLSVVNPLEVLRQRLMLDMARRRIHENQQQIVANAQLLELMRISKCKMLEPEQY
ncbi:CRF domain-containing protein [Trichonephila clavata]|uniref:CRF domain-containing protein n=1 Tax=Trichonephila clavata TaxID=2740835 RepID=A0A8X6M2N8_TRICU|nr:CRF domain-containing protein [Trichonephila clavata]